MLKRFVCAGISLLLFSLLFPLLFPSMLSAQQYVNGTITGPIPGREWPGMHFTFDQGLVYSQTGGRSLLLDLYVPHPGFPNPPNTPAVPAPVIVWIHGEKGPFDSRYPSPIASMTGNGYAVASIDYPNAEEATVAQQLEACRAAVRWLRTNADKYLLQADHIGVWGMSDGGRLAVLLGSNADPASSVQAVVDFAGPGAAKDLDPAAFASKDSAPVMIVHGSLDKAVPVTQSQALDAALRKAGASSTLTVVKGAGHDFKELKQGDAAEQVANFLDAKLNDGKHTRYWLGKIDPPADAWVDPIVDEPVGTHYVTFAAPVLGPGRMASYLLYLPPGYDKNPAKRYPVLYYLHGGSGSARVGDIWVQKLDAAIKAGVCPPMIAILVEGLPGGGFQDSADGKMPIESVIMKNLIPYVDATYRTIPRREARALEGLSMGGGGAFHLGFKYPEMFSMIFGMCNGVSDPNAPAGAGRGPRTQSAYALANNPFVLAEKNLAQIKGRIKIRSIVGTDDMTLYANKDFDARLTQLGIPHDFSIVPNVSHGYKEYYAILDFSFFKGIATM